MSKPPTKPLRPAAPLRPATQEELRQTIKVAETITRLEQHVAGTRPMEATQVQAAKVLLDKSLPSLQAVEVNQVSDRDKMSESDIIKRMAELVARNPELGRLVTAAASNVDVIDVIPEAPAAPAPAPFTPVASVECVLCDGTVVAGVCVECGAMYNKDGSLM